MKTLIIFASGFALLAAGCSSESTKDAGAGNPNETTSQQSVSSSQTPCRVFSTDLIAGSDAVSVSGADGVASLTSSTSLGGTTGKTAGARLRIDGACESFFSGNTIKVRFSARSSANTSMNVAYTTNEVGNSGWNKFQLGNQFEVYEFEYDVPQLKVGGADFLGFLPLSGNADIKNISITLK